MHCLPLSAWAGADMPMEPIRQSADSARVILRKFFMIFPVLGVYREIRLTTIISPKDEFYVNTVQF